MNKLSAALCATALMLGMSQGAQAQEETNHKSYPHMFIGLQGGAQTTLTDVNAFDIMTPTAAVSFGAYFNRVVGARLHANGIWNQGMLKDSKFKYDYKYVTTDVDLLLNITNLFRKGDDHVFNFILLGGVGLNTHWGNDDLVGRTDLNRGMAYMWDGTHITHNARVGAQLNFNCSRVLDFNIEFSANSLGDRYNSKMTNSDDWALNLMAGLAFKFGHRKAKPAPVVEEIVETPAEVWETRIDTIWYDDKVMEDVLVDMTDEYYVQYQLDQYTGADAGIKAAIDIIKSYESCTVEIVGYADKQTGRPKYNMNLSKQRAANTFDGLVASGIDKGTIKTSYKGDTVQPFADNNEKNRCTHVKIAGKKKVQQEKTERKFRTEEKRVRVQ